MKATELQFLRSILDVTQISATMKGVYHKWYRSAKIFLFLIIF